MRNYFQLLLQISTYLTTFAWILTGLIIIGSIYLSRTGIITNLVVGILFLAFGIYFFLKEKFILKFLKRRDLNTDGLLKKVILGELIFIIIALLIGIIALSAVSLRVFIKGFSVFDWKIPERILYTKFNSTNTEIVNSSLSKISSFWIPQIIFSFRNKKSWDLQLFFWLIQG